MGFALLQRLWYQRLCGPTLLQFLRAINLWKYRWFEEEKIWWKNSDNDPNIVNFEDGNSYWWYLSKILAACKLERVIDWCDILLLMQKYIRPVFFIIRVQSFVLHIYIHIYKRRNDETGFSQRSTPELTFLSYHADSLQVRLTA